MENVNVLQDEDLELARIEELHDFYSLKSKSDPKSDIIFSRLRINERLMKLGYYRLNEDEREQYVYVSGNVVERVTSSQVISAFERFVKDLPARHIMTDVSDYWIESRRILEALYKNIGSYLNAINRMICDVPFTFLRDTRNKKFFCFGNGVAVCSAGGMDFVRYDELDMCVWREQILPHDLCYSERRGDFEIFVEHICGEDMERKKQLMSLMGYLLHDNYESNRVAVLFTDAETSGVGEDSGGTGKGILGKAFGAMLNGTKDAALYVSVPGRDFDASETTRYSLANKTTQLIHIEDISDKLDFHQLYNDITDGATIRQLHHDRYIKDLKLMLSTNKTISVQGSSTKRRLVVFELKNFYSHLFTPEDEFGRRFFESDWSDDDWNMFYSFMLRCVVIYLRDGLLRPAELNFSARRVDEVFANREDFRSWFEDKIRVAFDGSRLELGKVELRQEFTQKYTQYNNDKYVNRFTKWCKEYLQLAGLNFVELRLSVDVLIINPNDYDKQRAERRRVPVQKLLDV